MEWNEDINDRLRSLWSEGLSTAEIGRRLGVSKNAVVGKAHRLKLPARPSPIRKSEPGAARPLPRRQPVPPLPRLAPDAVPVPHMTLPAGAGAILAIAPPPRISRPTVFGPVASCCWPIGEPGSNGFRFCSEVSRPGKPYCEAHAAVAYVKPKVERREDAA